MQAVKNLWHIFLAFFIFVVGIVFLSITAALRLMKVPVAKGYFACGMLLICGAVCTFIDYDYVTLIIPNSFIVNMFDCVTQLFICYFLMLYLRSLLKSPGFYKAATVLINIWTFVILSYFFIQAFAVKDGVQFPGYLLIIPALFITPVTAFIIIDLKKYGEPRTENAFLASSFLSVCALLDVINYYITGRYWIELFQAALAVFTMIQLFIMVNYTKENMLKATDAISDFADFLRVNIGSLSSLSLIDFERELVHVKAYLSLEQIRFEKRLKIVYDIKTTCFTLLSLTVQPIVENAVRHGVTKKKEGGTVTLSARLENGAAVITVSDDGAGFNSAPGKNGNRVGIENVRRRLSAQCGGTIEIKSEKGAGTSVVITVPQRVPA